MDKKEQILQFWFGSCVEDFAQVKQQSQIWFGKSEKIDNYIREKFAEDIVKAECGDYDSWKNKTKGYLALIILMDQFSRNIYRDNARAYACDSKALALSIEAVKKNIDQELAPVERIFIYLPFEHSESLDMQKESVRLFEQLLEQAPAEQKSHMESTLLYAEQHMEIIERFNRFPHRNKILNRKSTEEEIEFLKQPGSSF